MAARAGLQNEDMEFVQFHPTGTGLFVYQGRFEEIISVMKLVFYILNEASRGEVSNVTDFDAHLRK